MKKKVFVIIPAYNESERIGPVIKKAKKYCKNIVVVDDGSKDNTQTVAEKEKVTVLRHIVNLGKGAALKTGCDYALKKGAETLIVMDSDGQHQPEDIPRFLKALGKKDIVFSARKRSKEKMPFVLRFGNWVISTVNKILFGVEVKDATSGYRTFTAKTYKKIKWQSTGYTVEAEMIANVGKNRLKYGELMIKTIYSDDYKGTTIMDGVKIVLNMIWWKLTRW